jgi:hypothetical protein
MIYYSAVGGNTRYLGAFFAGEAIGSIVQSAQKERIVVWDLCFIDDFEIDG